MENISPPPIKITYLPIITIQHDFPQVLTDIKNEVCSAEDVWVSCYHLSQSTDGSESTKSLHAKIRVTSTNQSSTDHPSVLPWCLESRDGIESEWAIGSTEMSLALLISCPSLSIPPTRVSFPTKTLTGVQNGTGIDCMDVAGDWIATAGKNGNLRIDRWRNLNQTEQDDDHHDGSNHRVGRGHVSDLTTCQFFPSGQVLLTTSIDMSARIFSIYPDSTIPTSAPGSLSLLLNPRTFSVPHSRAVSAASIIERGKEIVTACRDGKLRIWNVAESLVINEGTWSGADSGSVDVLAMAIGTKRFVDRNGDQVSEDSQKTYFLALALSCGQVCFAHLPSLTPISLSAPFPPQHNSPIDALAISPDSDLIAVGTRSGTITLATLTWQCSNQDSLLLTPLATWKRNSAAVNSIHFTYDRTSILVGGSDGLPYRCRIGAKPTVEEELAGFDCDPVNSVRAMADTNISFAAGKDGAVRIYNA